MFNIMNQFELLYLQILISRYEKLEFEYNRKLNFFSYHTDSLSSSDFCELMKLKSNLELLSDLIDIYINTSKYYSD